MKSIQSCLWRYTDRLQCPWPWLGGTISLHWFEENGRRNIWE